MSGRRRFGPLHRYKDHRFTVRFSAEELDRIDAARAATHRLRSRSAFIRMAALMFCDATAAKGPTGDRASDNAGTPAACRTSRDLRRGRFQQTPPLSHFLEGLVDVLPGQSESSDVPSGHKRP